MNEKEKEAKLEKLCADFCNAFNDFDALNLNDQEIEEYESLLDSYSLRASQLKYLSHKEIIKSDAEMHKAEIEFFLKSSISEKLKQKARDFKAQFQKYL